MEAVCGWVWIFSGIAQLIVRQNLFTIQGALDNFVSLEARWIIRTEHFKFILWNIQIHIFLFK